MRKIDAGKRQDDKGKNNLDGAVKDFLGDGAATFEIVVRNVVVQENTERIGEQIDGDKNQPVHAKLLK